MQSLADEKIVECTIRFIDFVKAGSCTSQQDEPFVLPAREVQERAKATFAEHVVAGSIPQFSNG